MRTLLGIVGFLWESTRGNRLRPWRSPYLRWRIETYAGLPADSLNRSSFLQFTFRERPRLLAFLRWAGRMRAAF